MTAGATIAEVGERALIQRIRAAAGAAPPWVAIGIGDDAAVVEAVRNQLEVLTTDALVEDVHFRLAWCSYFDVGAKALAVNLSDLAAMGADPRGALLSLALPARTRIADFDALVAGWMSVAQTHRVALLGGNITRTAGPLVVDVTVTGAVRRRRVLTRAGGRAGDVLFVSGTIGAAAAGLAWLTAEGSEPPAVPADIAPAVARYRQPQPRVRLGQRLGRSQLASACMDLSDGLADAVRQLAEASGTGAAIDAGSLPIDPAARRVWSDDRAALDRALGGGDDYELLFAVPARRARRLEGREPLGVPVTRIGTLTPGGALVLERGGEECAWPDGFTHFGDNLAGQRAERLPFAL